ncbi:MULTISPECIES: single-stranded DNA-binding protein [unclassified Corynebacterium]|uniref:single-stranded DNA-binding protein n=1 Tax=unclassified Corynebacterium TaxID=2624378 RepID=UPI0029CA5350|nr:MULTISPECIES: single-stranded DNA-binding protein [unclassified Corynebacterium]WPF65654.1 single-stranded DNA-binding protein [Corynebacterium sp. 22KM0430]WPF68150.1 single-stranded DNA-binding protein [Corynebacterium sp. 21KM1197]
MANTPITITGNLTQDPTLKRTESGALVCRIRLGADRRVPATNGTGWTSLDSLFIDVEMWGDLAYNTRCSVAKGMPVIVSGHLVTTEWTDPATGEKRSRILLRARHVGVDLSKYQVRWRKCRVTAQHSDNGALVADDIDPTYLDEDKNPEASVPVEEEGFAQAPQAVPLPPEPEEEDHPMAA